MIVEDEEIIRSLCRRLLSAGDRELIFAENVQEALHAIQNSSLDLLISDLKLPDGHGVDVIRRFKERFPEKKAIVTTGSPSPEERLEAIKDLWVSPCLYKPFSNEDLERAVRDALGEINGNHANR